MADAEKEEEGKGSASRQVKTQDEETFIEIFGVKKGFDINKSGWMKEPDENGMCIIHYACMAAQQDCTMVPVLMDLLDHLDRDDVGRTVRCPVNWSTGIRQPGPHGATALGLFCQGVQKFKDAAATYSGQNCTTTTEDYFG